MIHKRGNLANEVNHITQSFIAVFDILTVATIDSLLHVFQMCQGGLQSFC